MTRKTQSDLPHLYSCIFKDATDPIFIEDLNGTITDINNEAIIAYGWSRDELIGKPIKTIIPSIQQDQAVELINLCRIGESVRNIKTERLTKDGSVLPVLITLSLLIDNENQQIGIATFCRKITEQEHSAIEIMAANQQLSATEQQLRASNQQLQAANQQLSATEQQLRASNQQLQATNQQLRAAEQTTREAKQRYEILVNNIPGAVYSALPDESGTTTFMSDRWEDWTGYKPRDFYDDHNTWPSSIHPDDVNDAVSGYIRACREGCDFVAEYRIVHRKTGAVRWVRDHGSAVKDQEGQVIRVDGVVTNITQQKETEKTLRDHERLLREMGQIAHIGGWEFDTTTGKGTWTEEVARIHDLDPLDETSMEQGLNFYQDESRIKIDQAIKSAIAFGTPYDLELELISAKGIRKWVRTIGNPIMENGKIVQLQGSFQDITSQRLSQESLRESESKLRDAQRMARLGHWFWDVNTGEVEWSEEVFKIFHFNPNEFKPQIDSILELSAKWPEDRQRGQELIQRAIESHDQGFYEQRFLRPDGSTGYYASSFQGIYDNNDKLIAIKGTVQDITKRKVAEKALQEERERLSMIIQGSRLGTWVWDAKTNEIVFNKRWASMLGYTHEELSPCTYETWTNLLHPDDLECATARAQRCLSDEAPEYDSEFRMRHKDGYWVWVMARGRILTRDAQGQPQSMFGTHTDITDLKNAEKEVRTSEKRFRNLFDNMSSGVAVYEVVDDGNDFVFKDFNKAGERIDNISKQEVLGRRITEVFPGVKDLELFDVLRRVWKTGTAEHHPVKLYLDDRISGWRENFVYKLPSNEIVAIYDDVTERKKAEEELEYTVKRVQHLNRVLDAIRNINRLIVREKDPDQLIKEACELLVETRKYSGAWIIRGDLHSAPLGVFGAGLEKTFTDLSDNLASGWLFPCAQQLQQSGQDVITMFTHQDCKDCPFQPNFGQELSICLRLHQDKVTQGMLIVAIPDTAYIDDDEQTLLIEIAGDIAFALHNIEVTRLQQEAETRFQTITESSPDAIFIADKTGKYTYVNDAAANLLGYTPEELLQLGITDISAKGQKDTTLKRFQELLEKEKIHSEIDLICKDGSTVPVDLNAVLLSNGRVYGSCRDLTEHKAAQREVAQREQLLSTIATNMFDMVSLTDMDTRITYASPSHRQLGYDPQNLIGKIFHEYVHEEDLDEVMSELIETSQGNQAKRVAYRHKQHDGSYAWLESVCKELTDDQGKPTGLIFSSRDMTDRRALEAQLAQSDRLSSMGMLAAGVAHEINNPLAYVLFNLESLTDDLPNVITSIQQVHAWPMELRGTGYIPQHLLDQIDPSLLDDILSRFKDALSGIYRIRDIARGLATFSRVEKEQLVPISLTHVIEVALSMAFNEIKYRARLVKEYTKTPTILASEGRLSQVFLNLIINATHAIDEGDAENNEIKLKTWSDGNTVFAEVRDTGSGIAPENLNKLFEPFFTTKKIGVGSGLGLAISKNIIESYGGTIALESELGSGTSFIVSIPIKTEDTVITETNLHNEALHTNQRGRVLIIDDEEGIRAAIVRMLSEHETVEAASGAEAIAIMKKDQKFDLILCDMMMSDISGMDVHKWLVHNHPFLVERLVFITGGAFTPRTREYLSKIDNIRLEKPFDIANFKKIANTIIREAKSDEQ